MDLQISVFLLFILLTGGHSLSCYYCASMAGSCAGQVHACESGFSKCVSLTAVTQIGNTTTTVKTKGCALPSGCQTWSFNFGTSNMSSSCCDTELCNTKDAPDSNSSGKKCYYCDGKSCSQTLSCSGDEDLCITATGTTGGQSSVVKGCASKAICDASATASVKLASISCCDGNLCNGAQMSFTESSTSNGAQSTTSSFTQSSTSNGAQSATQSSTSNGAQSTTSSFTQSSTSNGAQSATQSSTSNGAQSATQSSTSNGAQSATQSSTSNGAQSVPQSSTSNGAQSTTSSFTQSSTSNGAQSTTSSFTQSSTSNGAQSATQSFVFLCCSLLSYFLLH